MKVQRVFDGHDPKNIEMRLHLDWTEVIESPEFLCEVIKEVARVIADKIIIENWQDITAKISQEAIATHVVAIAGGEIAKSLKDQTAEQRLMTHELSRKEIYQRGLFGVI